MLPDHNPSLKLIRAETSDRNSGTRTMEELCLLANSLFHAQPAYIYGPCLPTSGRCYPQCAFSHPLLIQTWPQANRIWENPSSETPSDDPRQFKLTADTTNEGREVVLVSAVPVEARRGHCTSWNWGYKSL